MLNTPSSDVPHARPADLAPEEHAVADWLASLPRVTPPATLRARVLAASIEAGSANAESKKTASPDGVRARWVYAAAAAAVVLLAVGILVGTSVRSEAEGRAGPGAALATAPGTASSKVVVVDDPALGLMHGLETFDHLGLDQSELIAEWGH